MEALKLLYFTCLPVLQLSQLARSAAIASAVLLQELLLRQAGRMGETYFW